MKRWLFATAISILLVLAVPLSQGVTVESKAGLKSTRSVQGILCYIHSEGKVKNITCWKGLLYFNYNHLRLEYTEGYTEVGFPFFFPVIINMNISGQRILDIWFFKGNLTISGENDNIKNVTIDGFAILAYCG